VDLTPRDQPLATQTNPKETSGSKKQLQIWLKTISVHSYSQLPELQDDVCKKEPIILIARITPIFTKSVEEGTKLVNELYSMAAKNHYSVFRLGEERIIVVPPNVQVKDQLLG
jgi:SepF-like predicted cell division protein (DUF552 family)